MVLIAEDKEDLQGSWNKIEEQSWKMGTGINPWLISLLYNCPMLLTNARELTISLQNRLPSYYINSIHKITVRWIVQKCRNFKQMVKVYKCTFWRTQRGLQCNERKFCWTSYNDRWNHGISKNIENEAEQHLLILKMVWIKYHIFNTCLKQVSWQKQLQTLYSLIYIYIYIIYIYILCLAKIWHPPLFALFRV